VAKYLLCFGEEERTLCRAYPPDFPARSGDFARSVALLFNAATVVISFSFPSSCEKSPESSLRHFLLRDASFNPTLSTSRNYVMTTTCN
ncbi:hypothetical protein LTR46_012141, partial [Exophiala xenobiotica]